MLAAQLWIRPDARQTICFEDYFRAFRTFLKISVQESPFLRELQFDASLKYKMGTGIFIPDWYVVRIPLVIIT